MPVRLRFSLHGTRHNRIFHLVAIDQSARRNAKPTELLGIYNRYMNKDGQKTVEWSVDRIRYWLKVGAIPTKSVAKLLELVSFQAHFLHVHGDTQVSAGKHYQT